MAITPSFARSYIHPSQRPALPNDGVAAAFGITLDCPGVDSIRVCPAAGVAVVRGLVRAARAGILGLVWTFCSHPPAILDPGRPAARLAYNCTGGVYWCHPSSQFRPIIISRRLHRSHNLRMILS